MIKFLYSLLCVSLLFFSACTEQPDNQKNQQKLLNVSYDVSRDFYKDYNDYFIAKYKLQYPEVNLTIDQSHGGSGKQAFSVANGLNADVVTLNQVSDIDFLVTKKIVNEDWNTQFPNQAVPFSTVTVFLVRKGNPKQIHDWDDLINKEVTIVAPNPKTSGTARYVFLSAYIHTLLKNNNSETVAKNYVRQLYKKIPVLDSGGRAATNSFIQRKIGDVLIGLENEAYLSIRDLPKGEYEIIYPSISVKAIQPVAVTVNAAKNHNTQLAKLYIQTLWDEKAQIIAAKNYFRTSNPTVAKQYQHQFPEIKIIDATSIWQNWPTINQKFFTEGGIYDQIYRD